MNSRNIRIEVPVEKIVIILLMVECETPQKNWDKPVSNPPSFRDEFSRDARNTGNRLFGNVEEPNRIPSGDEITDAFQPQVPSADCTERPKRLAELSFGPDPKYSYFLKNYPRPSRGCTSYSQVSLNESKQLMSSQKLKAVNATNREVRTIGAAIKRAQFLNGGVLKTGVGPKINNGPYPFVFKNSNGSSQRANQINIGRNTSRGHNHYGHSVAQHVHEWAHLI